MEAYLVQRASFENRKDKKGIDSLLLFDYMGSSEFEWGALPKSLGRIRKNINEMTFLDIPIRDKVVSVCCHNSQKTEIKQYLENMVEGKFNTKGFTAFDSYVKNDGYFKDKFDFWWDIENDFFFWKKNSEFEENFKIALNNF